MAKKLLLPVVAILAILCGEVAYLSLKPPNMAPPSGIKVEPTPERIARGEYLVNVTSSCGHCHSVTDATKFGEPVAAGGALKGHLVPKEMGLPGEFSVPNLTPDLETGIGRMTDGELIRGIREGIGADGRVLFPFMPYTEFKEMSDDDVQSVVAYLRSVPPVKNALPVSRIAFPVGLFIKSVPEPVRNVPNPDRNDAVKYGKYLATISGCKFCHTPVVRGSPVAGREFSGGHEFGAGEYRAVSFNLTPHPETGLGRWTEEQFLKKFYDYKDYAANGPPPVKPESFTVMPWLNFTRLTPEDLKAIFAFLKTVPPIENAVETRPGAPKDNRKS